MVQLHSFENVAHVAEHPLFRIPPQFVQLSLQPTQVSFGDLQMPPWTGHSTTLGMFLRVVYKQSPMNQL